MNRSERGFFYGNTTELIQMDGITLTDTEYSAPRVDWHFHKDDYFTFLLEGGMREINKKETYECVAGDLLFHNWQDAHYNIAADRPTRGFHVELQDSWYERLDIPANLKEGSIRVSSPLIKTMMYNLFKEMKLAGPAGQLGVDALLAQILAMLGQIREERDGSRPTWVKRVRELLHDGKDDWNLVRIAREVNIHPVHLSREFPKHFHTNLGDYLRMVKVQRSIALLPDRRRSLTDIALECGFADQSHYIRSFKAYQQITPLDYRNLLKQAGGAGC
ncbi:helix-turn-helix transcriptional regulator [Dinghuibacter silviterrae]|uniref:AraC family transcriptional regulator n=1 Tax=Dinghuibacter silviterrae TaxID=1539049 RepID=A0A4R8DWC6_9BACT|nr:helix-turn-helix transcriptional regulator [Dinghuibacter silviterrae]TDX01521.1 AraC family transcriptional regulator [Dinghuibacter silviterrae]